MKKTLAGILIIAALILTFVSCGKKSNELKVGIMPDFDSIPFAVAKIEGYLPENIHLELFMSPMDRDAAFFAGELDGTISDTLAACLMREGGYEAYITSKTDGCYGVLTAKEIQSARELEDLEVGMSLNTVIEYVTYRIIDEAGGAADNSPKVSIPKIPSRLEMLFAGQIDAIAVPEPYVSAAQSRGAHVVATSVELGINPGVMLFFKESAEGKADALKELYEAYDKAVLYIQTHDPRDFMPAVIEELGLPAEALETELPRYTEAVLPEKSEIEAAGEWLLNKEMIKNVYSYDELIYEVK